MKGRKCEHPQRLGKMDFELHMLGMSLCVWVQKSGEAETWDG